MLPALFHVEEALAPASGKSFHAGPEESADEEVEEGGDEEGEEEEVDEDEDEADSEDSCEASGIGEAPG